MPLRGSEMPSEGAFSVDLLHFVRSFITSAQNDERTASAPGKLRNQLAFRLPGRSGGEAARKDAEGIPHAARRAKDEAA